MTANPSLRNGSSGYILVDGPTWTEAQSQAEALGGHLVTINNESSINNWHIGHIVGIVH